MARPAPSETREASARPPPSSVRPVTTIVFPAPVSPVSTVNPGCGSRVASSMTPSPWIRISANMGRSLGVTHDGTREDTLVVFELVFGPALGFRRAAAPAVDRQVELAHQPVGERLVGQ